MPKLLPKIGYVIPIRDVFLNGNGEILGSGYALEIPGDPNENLQISIVGPTKFALAFDPDEKPTRISMNITQAQPSIILFTNKHQVFLCGLTGSDIDSKVYINEINLPGGTGVITDYVINNGHHFCCDSDGHAWYCYREKFRRASFNGLKRMPLASNIQKVCSRGFSALLLDSDGKTFSYVGKTYYHNPLHARLARGTVHEYPQSDKYTQVGGIPEDRWIVDIGSSGSLSSYLLDNTGELWAYTRPYVDYEEELIDAVAPQRLLAEERREQAQLVNEIRDTDGRLHAEAIYIGESICFLRKQSGDWWVWSSSFSPKTAYGDIFASKEPGLSKCKLLTLTERSALFALPPGDESETSEVWKYSYSDDGNKLFENTGMKYQPPLPSLTKNARKRPLANTDEDGPGKKSKNSQIACSICFSDRATRSCGKCKRHHYCSPYCSSIHWRQRGHCKTCPGERM